MWYLSQGASFLASQHTFGVIRHVDGSVSHGQLLSLCDSGVKAVDPPCFRSRTTVQLRFKGDAIPAHVSFRLMRYVVRTYAPRPHQCHYHHQCHQIGHVTGSCLNSACCPKWSSEHGEKDCTSPIPKCVDCKKPHEANSSGWPQQEKNAK